MTGRRGMKREFPARGTRMGTLLQTPVKLEPEIFNQIRGLSIQNGISFSEQLRTLVGLGLEVARDRNTSRD